MEEVRKLLDNGWQVLVFRNGLGDYSALAVRAEASIDEALATYQEPDELIEGESIKVLCDRLVFGGTNRYCGQGKSVAEALRAVTEKVLFRRLPEKP